VCGDTDFKSGIVMNIPKGILEVKQFNNTSLIDDVSHLRGMFESARDLWSKALLNFTFDISSISNEFRRQDVKIFNGTDSRVIGRKLKGSAVSTFL